MKTKDITKLGNQSLFNNFIQLKTELKRCEEYCNADPNREVAPDESEYQLLVKMEKEILKRMNGPKKKVIKTKNVNYYGY